MAEMPPGESQGRRQALGRRGATGGGVASGAAAMTSGGEHAVMGRPTQKVVLKESLDQHRGHDVLIAAEIAEDWKRYGQWTARRNGGERRTVDLTKPGAEEPPVNRTVAR